MYVCVCVCMCVCVYVCMYRHLCRRSSQDLGLVALLSKELPDLVKYFSCSCFFRPRNLENQVRVAISFNWLHKMLQMVGYELGNDLVPGTRYLARYQISGTRYQVSDTRYLVPGIGHLLPGN